MKTVRVDSGFFRNRGVRMAGKDGRELFLTAACWASENNTGRRLPKAQLRWWSRGVPNPHAVAERLVQVGLWDEDDGAFIITSRLVLIGHREKIPAWLRRHVYDRDSHRCQVCGADTRLSIDHIRPVSRGGLTEPGNLRTLCVSCNSRKGAQWAG